LPGGPCSFFDYQILTSYDFLIIKKTGRGEAPTSTPALTETDHGAIDMATNPVLSVALNVQPFLIAFDDLSDRDALRLFEQLAERFSFSRGHDRIHSAIRTIAYDAAQDAGWRGEDLAERYLEADRHTGRIQSAPAVSLTVIEGGR